MSQVVVAALYKFSDLPDCAQKRDQLFDLCTSNQIKGTLLLAKEGINGTVAGSRVAIDALKAALDAEPRFEGMEYKESTASEMPFLRLKVRLKKEIVTLGQPMVDPTAHVGRYVEPQDWNALISDPDVVVVDTRNDYEYEIGSFQGAINPKTESFREFPEYVKEHLDPAQHKKVAMFCTGGIRCEKSTSYLLSQGFESVYHLKGGILKYLETVPEQDSLWKGECFVFDQRVGVTHGLQEGEYELCFACRQPISQEEKASERYREGVSCPKCYDKLTDKQRASFEERQKQILLAKARGQRHIGK